HVRTFEVTPAQVTRITAHEQTIRGRNALEKVVVLRVKAADQLELPSARPALAPADGRERIHSQIAYAIRSRLHGVASEKANRQLAVGGRREAIVERHLAAAERVVEVTRRPGQNAGRSAADVAHGTVGHDVADLVGGEGTSIIDKRHGIAGVLCNQALGIVERQRNALVAERTVLVLPLKMFTPSGGVRKGSREESENLLFVALAKGANGKARVNGHVSARPMGSRGS